LAIKFQRADTAREVATGARYLPTLDGWRAVAILAVMTYHGTALLFVADGPYPNATLFALVNYGTLGVPIFFAISGFLICTRLLEEERETGRISLSGFYLRRACRILPPYLLYLGVLALIAAAGVITVQPVEWTSSLLFYRNYVTPSAGGTYTSHFWSLSVEEHFYLLWPGLLVLFGARRSRWIVVLLALGVAAWRALESRHQWLAALLPGVGFRLRTDICIDGLLWGCWVALLCMIPAVRARLTRWLSPAKWLAIVGLFLVCLLGHPPLKPLWLALLLPFILLGTVLHPTAPVGRFLEFAALRWIGRLSYSLYIWQQLFLIAKDKFHYFPLGPLQRLPLNYLVVFACAALSYYLIERPLIGLGHRLTARSREAAVLSEVKLVGA
jgi:peptidoglycan/LPS O-acetylase OafA/YrhL